MERPSLAQAYLVDSEWNRSGILPQAPESAWDRNQTQRARPMRGLRKSFHPAGDVAGGGPAREEGMALKARRADSPTDFRNKDK